MSVTATATISVIMPVYNGEQYLRHAIESILQQSFTNFEFIIINDGSTEQTEDIILSYPDPRIFYIRNEVNKGLIYTLNRGISQAKGKYIARMDGDDIALRDRLQQQFEYLEKNQHIDVLATQVALIDENENDIGYWDEDLQHSNESAIKQYLPINNCLAHPSIMGRKKLFDQYKYNPSQKLSEDYDLWLRMTSDGKRIDKLPVVLIKYRVLPNSLTRIPKLNVFLKIAKIKRVFVFQQLIKGKLNLFVIKTFFYALADTVKGVGKLVFNKFKKKQVKTDRV